MVALRSGYISFMIFRMHSPTHNGPSSHSMTGIPAQPGKRSNIWTCRSLANRRPAAEDNSARVGLLVTHGIGVQREGGALSDFGDPLLSWASRWLEERQGCAVTWPSKTDRSMQCPYPECGEVGGPLHVHATWTVAGTAGQNAPETTVQVVIAESWWASEFKAPSASRLSDWLPALIWAFTWRGVLWCALFLTSIVFSVACLHRDWVSALFPAAATAALVTLMAILAAPALLLIGQLPFLTDKTKDVLDFLTLWVGDVFIYENYPLSAANARQKIHSDLQWLVGVSGADRTIVAAHSLGSLLAVDVLAAKGAPRVDALVTFGSPIRLLKRRVRRYVRDLDAECPTVAWVNVYDKMDFISGPVDYQDDFPVNLRVDNGQSILRSHGAYPDNAEQFLTALYRMLLGHDHSRETDKSLAKALKLRRHRSWVRHTLIAAAAPALMGLTLYLLKVGWPQALSDAVTGKKFVPEWVETVIHTGVPANDTADLTSAVMLCLVTAGIFICFVLWTVRLVFEWWETAAEEALSSRFKRPTPWWVMIIATVLMVAIILPPVIRATTASHAESINIGEGVLFEVGPAVAAGFIALYFVGVRSARHLKMPGPGTRPTKHANPLLLLGQTFEPLKHGNHKPGSWKKKAR